MELNGGLGSVQVMSILLIGVLFLVFIGMFVMLIGRAQHNNKLDILTAEVTILYRKKHVRRATQKHPNEEITYRVVFELEDSEVIELCVNEMQIEELEEGDYGLVTFQGEELLSFESYQIDLTEERMRKL